MAELTAVPEFEVDEDPTDLGAFDDGDAEDAPDLDPVVPEFDDSDSDDDATDEARAAAHRAGMERARLRKAVAKTVEVVHADKAIRGRLAALLSVDNDDVTLATAVLTADRAALADLDLLEEALSADGLGLGALVMQLVAEDRPKMRSLWALARQFGADLPERPPAQQMKIVRVLAGGIQAMGPDAAKQIQAVRALARRA